MTTQDKIEAIRQKCIEANPEIVELKFGCEVQAYMPEYGELHDPEYSLEFTDVGVITNSPYLQVSDVFGDIMVEDLKKDLLYYYEEDRFEFTIIGRPIRLADVLMAIQHRLYKVRPDYWLNNVFPLVCWHYECSWRFDKDNLTQQSDETISFIYELVKE